MFGFLFWVSIGSLFAADFRLQSPTLREGGMVPVEHLLAKCGGRNLSPDLAWSGAPAGTKSFAVTFFDPDAPGGHGFWHWAMFDLPPKTERLPAGAGASTAAIPGAKQARNDYGSIGYGGPCPPEGSTHRYILTVTALNLENLPVSPHATAGEVAALISKHALGKATITVRYGR